MTKTIRKTRFVHSDKFYDLTVTWNVWEGARYYIDGKEVKLDFFKTYLDADKFRPVPMTSKVITFKELLSDLGGVKFNGIYNLKLD